MLKNLIHILSKNNHHILTATSILGLGLTVYFTVDATPKALEIIKRKELKQPIDIVKNTWKVFLPVGIAGGFTIASILGLNCIHLKRHSSILGLYSLTDTAFREYKKKVVEKIGEAHETKIRDSISADELKNLQRNTEVIITGKGDILCYDTISGRCFKFDVDRIKKIVNDINYKLRTDMFIPLNDFYYELGLNGIKIGDELGWSIEKGQLELTFSAHLNENEEPCVCLNYDVFPKYY